MYLDMEHFEKIPNMDCNASQILNTTTWGPGTCTMMCNKYLECFGIKWMRSALVDDASPNCVLFKECHQWQNNPSVDLYIKGSTDFEQTKCNIWSGYVMIIITFRIVVTLPLSYCL